MKPPQSDASSNASPDPEFMKKFQAVIQSWSESTSAGKTEEAQNAAIEALIMAGEEGARAVIKRIERRIED